MSGTRLTLMYSPGVGTTVPDGKIEEWFKEKIARWGDDEAFEQVGSEVLILRGRVGLVEGDLASLVIRYEGVDYKVNEDGTLDADFWIAVDDTYSSLLMRVLDGRFK